LFVVAKLIDADKPKEVCVQKTVNLDFCPMSHFTYLNGS